MPGLSRLRGLRHPYTWGRDHPLVVDCLIALLVLALGLLTEFTNPQDDGLRETNWFGVLLCVVTTVPLVARRRHALAVFLLVYPLMLVHGAMHYPGAGPVLGALFALYAVAAHVPNRRTAVLCLAGSLIVVPMAFFDPQIDADLWDVVTMCGFLVTAWVIGDNMRTRRAYVVAVEERAERLERERDAEAQQAVLRERGRIAREMHDVVAHNMSVMIVQAGAARRTLARDPERAAEALGHIESTGRSAMDEMRRLVGVLRQDAADRNGDEAAGNRLPQPGIDELPGLVEHLHGVGLDVHLRIEGDERPLPSGLELVVFRVVQEALTNTMKHAGPARADVLLCYGATSVTVTIVDDGRGAAAPVASEAGHGLTGMRERVSLYGGEIAIGPQAGGGFRVRAELPLEARSG